MTPTELREIMFSRLPRIDDHGNEVEEILTDGIVVRLPYDERQFGTEIVGGRAVKGVSGEVVMGLADVAMYGACLAVAGPDILAVVVTMTTSFLRPAAEADFLADARVRRLGGRLAYLDCTIRSEGLDDPVAHVVATYALRPR